MRCYVCGHSINEVGRPGPAGAVAHPRCLPYTGPGVTDFQSGDHYAANRRRILDREEFDAARHGMIELAAEFAAEA